MFGGARDQGFHTTKGITDFPAFWVFSFFIGNKTNLTSTYEPGDGLAQSILYGSVVEHRSTESKSLRFNPSWVLGTFALSHTRDETKNTCF